MTWTRSLLKYPGGKYSLLEVIDSALPRGNVDIYAEPFLGGASVALNIGRRYPEMILNDANIHLIGFWSQLSHAPAQVQAAIQKLVGRLELKDSKDVYLEVREAFNSNRADEITQAAMFYFLNKQGFNGLIRYNSSGLFNVPHGKYKRFPALNEEHFQDVSSILSGNVAFHCVDANKFIERVLVRHAHRGKKLFVYLDPPYIPITKTANFTCYWKPFAAPEHEKLRKTLDKLTELGVLWMLSNSKCEETEEIFQGYNFIEVSAPRSISCRGDGRGSIQEYLITNYRQ